MSCIHYSFLQNNKITAPPSATLMNSIPFYSLDFADNGIEEIPYLFFYADPALQLQVVLLQWNRLTTISSWTFDYLMFVKAIFLSNNRIHFIEGSSFLGPFLTSVYLFGNNLSEVQNNPFTGGSLLEIHLYGNNIRNLSKTFTMGIASHCTVFLNCASLGELPRDTNHERIKCVNPNSLPMIIPHQKPKDILIVRSFEKNGFICTIEGCVPCSPGTFADRISNGCLPCPRGGFFQDEIGQLASNPGETACKKCNNGTFVRFGGGSSTSDCEVCPGGTAKDKHAGYRACACKDRYARNDRYGPCYLCEDEGLNCSADFKSLLPGYTWNWNFPTANITLYERFVENMRQEHRQVDSYTSYNQEIPRTFKCQRRESCVNDDGSIQGACEVGYRGWLCSKCEQGYYSVLSICLRCPSMVIMVVESLIVFFFVIFTFVILLWPSKKEKSPKRVIRTGLNVVISRMKIMLGFYQVVGEIVTSVHDMKWSGPLIIVGRFISSLELNVLKLFVRPRCYDERLDIDPKVGFIIAIILPIAIILLPAVVYFSKKGWVFCRRRFRVTGIQQRSFQELKSNLQTSVVVVLYIVYPGVCSSIFQLYPLSCQTFYLDSGNEYGIVRLRSDLEVSCSDLSVYHWLAYLFTGTYVIAFPATLLYVLWMKWRCEKKAAPLEVPCPRQESANIEHENEPDHLDEEESLTTALSEMPAHFTEPWQTFLCENYKEKFWFWEIIELTRKVSQTFLITLYGWEDRLTVLLTTCTSVTFLVLHARYRPMKSSYEQHLQMMSLTVIFINVLVAANDVSESYGSPVALILVFLNALMLVTISGEVLVMVILHVKHVGFRRIIATVRTFVNKLFCRHGTIKRLARM